jgi:hypothetical protein
MIPTRNLARFIVVGLLVVLTSNGVTTFASTNHSSSPPAKANVENRGPLEVEKRTGKAKKHLGYIATAIVATYGYERDAQELLQLMEEKPGKAIYLVSYKTEDAAVVFACGLNEGLLVRVEKDFHGERREEDWRGYVLDRLKSAAEGGSLNDTP